MISSWLWIAFTVAAAFFQTLRNAMQRELTTSLGTVGATHVRFLFGLPFALLSLIGVLLVTGVPLPRPSLSFWPWVIDGAGAQMAATFTLVVGLVMQAVVLSLYLLLRQPSAMIAILRAWKPSLFAGLMGALASQFWFLAFAIATAASVRTLALIEVLFAQIVARVMFGQKTTAREAFGMALVVAGVALLIFAEK